MSVYILEDRHIGYLVDAARSARLGSGLRWRAGGGVRSLLAGDDRKSDEVGQMLRDVNVSSVESRYPGENLESLVYRHKARARPIDPVQVLKSIDCYEYQCAASPAWEASGAKAFCDALRASAIQALPGYDEASWGAPD